MLRSMCTDWTEEESKVPGGNAHLWEESWDDDDQNEDFSKQLRYEILPCSACVAEEN